MKKLPKIYQNNINKTIKNNKNVCYLKDDMSQPQKEDNQSIETTLDKIFSGIGYSYNIPVLIETPTKVYDTSLVAKTSNNIITLDNEIIPLTNITSLKIKDEN